MRFASCLFVGVAVLLVACVGLTSLRHRDGAALAPASRVVSEGNPAVLHRLEAKSAVTRRLLDGELTLLEAAAWFRYVDRTTGTPNYLPIPGEEDKSEAERICRQVIRWADARARQTSPEDSETVVCQLKAELDERLGRDGGVELPESP